MTTTLDAARAYASRGWAVLPCEPRGKRPLSRLVRHGLKDATTDPTTVERWWRAAPQANIGLVTGIAFDALDVDAAGWGPLSRLVAAHGPMNLSPVAMSRGTVFTTSSPQPVREIEPGSYLAVTGVGQAAT